MRLATQTLPNICYGHVAMDSIQEPFAICPNSYRSKREAVHLARDPARKNLSSSRTQGIHELALVYMNVRTEWCPIQLTVWNASTDKRYQSGDGMHHGIHSSWRIVRFVCLYVDFDEKRYQILSFEEAIEGVKMKFAWRYTTITESKVSGAIKGNNATNCKLAERQMFKNWKTGSKQVHTLLY